jgi:hypothetical protein
MIIPSRAQRPEGDARRGGALALALIVAVTVAAASAGILLVSSHFARRQSNAVHDQRAFYLAEAGLSEAYNALTIGKTGQIGSLEQPAASGEGFVWVDATEVGDGTVRLESTGVVGLGRASLALVVERVEQPLGIFADKDLIIDAPILVDGYDSETAPYLEQVGLIPIPRELVQKIGTGGDGRTYLAYEGNEYVVVEEDASYYYVEPLLVAAAEDGAPEPTRIDSATDPLLATNIMVADTGGWATTAGSGGALTDATTEPTADATEPLIADSPTHPATTELTSATSLGGPHTTGGGMIGSNGNVTFAGAPAAIYGDVVAGPDSQVVLGDGIVLTGGTSSRSEAVELPVVVAPDVLLEPVLEHGGPVPLVIPPSTVGYQGLRVLSDAEVIVRGPSTVVIGTFELLDRAALIVENLDGPVDLYVTQAADFALGSFVDVQSEDPSQLTLRIAGPANSVRLAASSEFHGMVYGPQADIEIEAPFELFGVLVGGTLDLGANVRMHFDSGIAGDSGRLSLPKLISWDVNEVPPQVRARINPADLFGTDPSTAPSPIDAGETNSWTFYIRYHSLDGGKKWLEYDGPYQDFDWSEVKDYGNSSFTPPSVEFPEPWTINSRYLCFRGHEHTFEGPVADYNIFDVEREYERTLIPPPELAALGVQPYHDAFTVP